MRKMKLTIAMLTIFVASMSYGQYNAHAGKNRAVRSEVQTRPLTDESF